MKPESKIQREIIGALRKRGYACFSVPNGSNLAGDKLARFKQMAAMKADGLMVGFPDLGVMALGGRIGFLEVKVPGGKTSPEQVKTHGLIAVLDHNVAVVRSVDDALAALRSWGWVA